MSNEFKDWYNDFSDEQKKNYELCMKYPVIVPTNRCTGEIWGDYDYDYTELDGMPRGWLVAFGEQWASEVQAAINQLPEECRYKVRILDLKEKYGQLCQYFTCYTDELDKIIDKYTRLSARTCISCGAPATKISQGWVSPWCNCCAEKIHSKMVDINVWYKEDDDNEDS